MSVSVVLHQEAIDSLPASTSVQRHMDELAEKVVQVAKELVPVATGALQASIVSTRIGNDRVVSAGQPYGVYVEFGTSVMAAQPFLRPALDEVMGMGSQ